MICFIQKYYGHFDLIIHIIYMYNLSLSIIYKPFSLSQNLSNRFPNSLSTPNIVEIHIRKTFSNSIYPLKMIHLAKDSATRPYHLQSTVFNSTRQEACSMARNRTRRESLSLGEIKESR